ncbi:MAG: tRNA (N6-isopentenyl adenosine(37)-C2)-methylthiotransferase MiaB [Planctomycetia bacterium]|nr:tRNA (N6-isopentenyl adenosine(37)-C2)-methylthiotransferase MiaB [Planctomycetia bacterium]
MNVKFYIKTVGCQMNVLDSELATADLLQNDCTPAETMDEADIILFNTCSVREHAEEKVYSALGRLRSWKAKHPQGVLGVMGCMAQKDGKLIFRRAPEVNLVLGPGRLNELSDAIARIAKSGTPELLLSSNRLHSGQTAAEVRASFHQYDRPRLLQARDSRYQAMVRIMFGCNKFCTYCIVPSVRGPEQSRPMKEIVQEVKSLVEQGCREVMLLGQTVNNWHVQDESGDYYMADLLERLNDINDLWRIRFVSSYPTGMTNRLLEAVRDLERVMPYLHVPAQHGANSVLKRMKRMYTVEEYRDLLDRIYAIIPGAAVTSDFIVGFCGETEEEYLKTVELVRYGQFKNSFIFKYSPRPGTKSAELYEDDVPEEEKKRRNNDLLAIQTEISQKLNNAFLNQTVSVLVEGPSLLTQKEQMRDAGVSPLPVVSNLETAIQMTGRTPCDRIVVFNGKPSLAGTIQQVQIKEIAPFTLAGELVR